MEASLNTKRIGNTAEAKLLAAFVEQGWSVLLPFGDNEPYDMVIDRGNGFERVQVKNGHHENGCVVFNGYSLSGRTHNQVAKKYQDLCDLFGVYYPVTDEVFVVPVADVGLKPRLRFGATKRKLKTIRWAKDYVLPKRHGLLAQSG